MSRIKLEYYDLEEGMIVLGYNLSKSDAIKFIHKREKRRFPELYQEELLPAEDIKPIYELTIVRNGYDEGYYTWDSKPTEDNSSQIIGWVITA